MPDKSILLISPQAWGKMFVAKHHYAVELSRCGYNVYFLNPPEDHRKQFATVEQVQGYPGLQIVHHGPFFPLMLRFRFRKIYDVLMKRYVKWLSKQLNQSFEVAWCFEPNLYSNLDWFNAKFKLYHPVDELFYDYQLAPGKNADLIVSVTHEILAKFKDTKAEKLFVNHGISREFADAVGNHTWQKKNSVTIGYSGNLLRKDIDFETLRQCIDAFPSARFVFWGNYDVKQSNLAGEANADIVAFIDFLKRSPNVELKGAIKVQSLVEEYSVADIFLICYDINKDQSRGTNYHKVMEFISTGRVIVSNNITTYKNCDLLRMCTSRDSNREFKDLLGDTITHREEYNSSELQHSRKSFAAENTYRQHVMTILQHLTN